MTETSPTSKIELTESERPIITILKKKKQWTELSSVPTTILPERMDMLISRMPGTGRKWWDEAADVDRDNG